MPSIDDTFVPDLESGSVGALPRRTQTLADDGDVTIADGTVYLTKATALDADLDDPPAGMPGARLRIVNVSGAAHTVTYSAAEGFNSAGTGSAVGTFASEAGSVVELEAINGLWYIVNYLSISDHITFAAS